MPNRWLKQAYCTSERIQSISPSARDCWVRLLVNADDHGYFHGSAQLVASMCYPLQPNARECERHLVELEAAKLIVRYESGGKAYLAITQWYERARSEPKYPPPPDDRLQLLATANNGQRLQASTSTTTTTTTTTPTATAPSARIALAADGAWEGVEASDRRLWRAAYPAIDLDAELAAAAAWAVANPANRKSNWNRFVTNWLKKAQDRARRVGGNGAERRAWE